MTHDLDLLTLPVPLRLPPPIPAPDGRQMRKIHLGRHPGYDRTHSRYPNGTVWVRSVCGVRFLDSETRRLTLDLTRVTCCTCFEKGRRFHPDPARVEVALGLTDAVGA